MVSQLFHSHPYKYLVSALAGLVCMGTTAVAGIIEAMTSQPANVDVFDCNGSGWLNWYCRWRFNVCVPFVVGIRKPCVDVSVIGSGGGGDCDWNVNAVRSPGDSPLLWYCCWCTQSAVCVQNRISKINQLCIRLTFIWSGAYRVWFMRDMMYTQM